MPNYATADNIREYKIAGTVVKNFYKYTDPEIEDRLEEVEAVIDSITGDCFYEKTETNQFDGNGLHKLFFPPDTSYRLLTITSLKEIDIDGTTVLRTYTENDDFIKYDYWVDMDLGHDHDRPRVRFGRGGIWPRGQKNIHVEGTWGRAAVPPAIKKATILLTMEALIPGAAKMANTDVKQAVWNDFTVTFKGSDAFGGRTGFVAVDRLLEDHINYSSLFMAVPDKRGTHDNGLGTFFRI